MVNMYWYKYFGVSFISDVASEIQKKKTRFIGDRYFIIRDTVTLRKNVFQIRLKVAPNVYLFGGIRNEKGKRVLNHSICNWRKQYWLCSFSAPKQGKYLAYISAKRNRGEKFYNKVYQFDLIGKAGKGIMLPQSNQVVIQKPNSGIRLLDYNFGNKNTYQYYVKLEHSAEYKVFSSIWDSNGKKMNGRVKRTMLSGDSKRVALRYDYHIPSTGVYTIKVSIKPKDTKYYQRAPVVVRIVK